MSAVERLRAAAQQAVDALARKEALGREFDALPHNSAIGTEWEAARDAWLAATDNEVCDALAAAVLALLDDPDGIVYSQCDCEVCEETRAALASAAAMLPDADADHPQ